MLVLVWPQLEILPANVLVDYYVILRILIMEFCLLSCNVIGVLHFPSYRVDLAANGSNSGKCFG